MRSAGLIAVGGRLHRDGVPYPLEFGNLEQIEFLQKATEREKQLTEGMEVYVDFEEVITFDVSTSFNCICGKRLQLLENSEYESCSILAKRTVSCSCKRTYTTSINEHDELILKLK